MANEPAVPNLIKKSSFFHMPTPAMRSAPELLIQELMEVIFNERDSKHTKSQYTTPTPELCSSDKFSIDEQFVISSFQGRRKGVGGREKYYAPAYPALARNSWFRSKDPVTVNGFLFDGPICHYLKSLPNSQDSIKEISIKIVDALIGDSSKTGTDKEIFSRVIDHNKTTLSRNEAIERLSDKIENTINADTQVIGNNIVNDFAKTVTLDLMAILELERKVPRHHWMSLLMGFLRVSMSLWLLYLAKNIVMLDKWISLSLNGHVVTQENIESELGGDSKSLLLPSKVVSDGTDKNITDWVKARLRVSIILSDLSHADVNIISDDEKNFILSCYSGNERLTIYDLLERIRIDSTNDKRYQIFCEKKLSIKDGSIDTINTRLIRACSKWDAYRNPLSKGQGKNAKEFLEVLRKSEGYDDRASHFLEKVTDIKDKRTFQWRISPGQLIIQMFAYFSALEVQGNKKIQRELVLRDIEDHFRSYGVDFTLSSDGRKLLIQKLENAGLVLSSPDAGASMKIKNPYHKFNKEYIYDCFEEC